MVMSYYGTFAIEILPSQSTIETTHSIQTDDIELDFSKVFTEYIKNIQRQNSQKANSIVTNDVFSIIYSYVSILETNETI